MSDADDLRRAAGRLTADERRGEHPEPAELVAYARDAQGAQGALTEERRDRLQEHLASCAECAGLLLDFADFDALEPPSAGRHLDAAEVAAARLRFERRLAEIDLAAAAPPAVAAGRGTAWGSPRPWQLLAAVLAAAAIGLAVWGGSLDRRLRRLGEPEINVATHDLEPVESGQVRAGAGAAPPAVVAVGAGGSILVLQLPGAEVLPAYRLAIRGADGREVASLPDAVLDPELGNFTLGLPRGSLPPGRYDIEIWGGSGEREEPLARYPIEVR
jgi:hypothetical protein